MVASDRGAGPALLTGDLDPELRSRPEAALDAALRPANFSQVDAAAAPDRVVLVESGSAHQTVVTQARRPVESALSRAVLESRLQPPGLPPAPAAQELTVPAPPPALLAQVFDAGVGAPDTATPVSLAQRLEPVLIREPDVAPKNRSNNEPVTLPTVAQAPRALGTMPAVRPPAAVSRLDPTLAWVDAPDPGTGSRREALHAAPARPQVLPTAAAPFDALAERHAPPSRNAGPPVLFLAQGPVVTAGYHPLARDLGVPKAPPMDVVRHWAPRVAGVSVARLDAASAAFATALPGQENAVNGPDAPSSVVRSSVFSATSAPPDLIRLDAAMPDLSQSDSQRFDAQRIEGPRADALRPGLPAMTVRQIADAVPSIDGPVFDLSLSPEELGQVRLRLISSEGGNLLIIQAERPETLDLLRRHIGTLEQDLRDLGHEGLTLQFSAGGGSADQGHHQPAAPVAAQDDPVTRRDPLRPGASTDPAVARLARSDHLDLRL